MDPEGFLRRRKESDRTKLFAQILVLGVFHHADNLVSGFWNAGLACTQNLRPIGLAPEKTLRENVSLIIATFTELVVSEELKSRPAVNCMRKGVEIRGAHPRERTNSPALSLAVHPDVVIQRRAAKRHTGVSVAASTPRYGPETFQQLLSIPHALILSQIQATEDLRARSGFHPAGSRCPH
jgi:hypothetical protein